MKKIILCMIMLLSSFSLFADYNQDLELRRHLDMFPKFQALLWDSIAAMHEEEEA